MTRPLDPATLERLARVVCDIDGPFEQKGWQLERLLERSGWTDSPRYDGSPRVRWLLGCLEDRRDRPGDVERLVCRVCDPLQYDDGALSAEAFRSVVNDVLAAEGLVVTFVQGRPVLGAWSGDGSAAYSAPTDLQRRLRVLIGDDDTASILYERARETQICTDNGAYTFAVIGIGSFVEGLLHSVLSAHDPAVRATGFRDQRGRPIEPYRIGLKYLIDQARVAGWIQFDAVDFVRNVNEYRNYVHLRKQVEQPQSFDRDTVMLCWAPVQAILNDMEECLTRLRADGTIH